MSPFCYQKSSVTWAREKGMRARARRVVWRNIVADGDKKMTGKKANIKKTARSRYLYLCAQINV
jgi:hypothetical protein